MYRDLFSAGGKSWEQILLGYKNIISEPNLSVESLLLFRLLEHYGYSSEGRLGEGIETELHLRFQEDELTIFHIDYFIDYFPDFVSEIRMQRTRTIDDCR